MAELSFEDELQRVFLMEAQEMLEDTESAFIRVESEPNNLEEIDKIFRLVHTIKGSSHIAGFSALGEFAHHFETLLSALRERTLVVTPDMIDVLLEGNDCLKKYVSALKRDRTAKLDLADVVGRIQACLPGARELGLTPKQKTSIDSGAPRQAKEVRDLEGPKPAAEGLNSELANTPSGNGFKHSNPAREWIEASEAGKDQVPRFLVCDDEPEILKLLGEILQGCGFEVLLAGSAKLGLEILNSQPVDVIFTDLQMPEMNGIEFLKVVRKTHEAIPVIFISGHSSREHFKEYLQLGVDGFVEKPFAFDDVILVAKKALRTAKMRKAVFSMARICFRAFVASEMLFSNRSWQDEKHAKDAQRLQQCIAQLQASTEDLLASERDFRLAMLRD